MTSDIYNQSPDSIMQSFMEIIFLQTYGAVD